MPSMMTRVSTGSVRLADLVDLADLVVLSSVHTMPQFSIVHTDIVYFHDSKTLYHIKPI